MAFKLLILIELLPQSSSVYTPHDDYSHLNKDPPEADKVNLADNI